jgi:hypothetical protein
MILSRTRFFILLLIAIAFPFLLYNIVWLSIATKTNGIVRFHGKAYTGQLVNEYSVVSFAAGKDTIWFNSGDGVMLKKGLPVSVYYIHNNPANARLGIFSEIWGPIIGYSSVPILVLMLAFIHPNLVPRHAVFKLVKKKPFVEVINL